MVRDQGQEPASGEVERLERAVAEVRDLRDERIRAPVLMEEATDFALPRRVKRPAPPERRPEEGVDLAVGTGLARATGEDRRV